MFSSNKTETYDNKYKQGYRHTFDPNAGSTINAMQQQGAQQKQVEQSFMRAELQEEFERDRDYILESLKQNLSNRDILAAKEIIDRFRPVASRDNLFAMLAQETDRNYEIYQNVEAKKALYSSKPADAHWEKLEICTLILASDPNNKTFIQNKITELDAIYQTTAENAFEERLSICNQILHLDPNHSKYRKEQRKVEKKYSKFRQSQTKARLKALTAARKSAANLVQSPRYQDDKIGNEVRRHHPLHGLYSSTNNPFDVPIQEGKIQLKIHTHGISITPSFVRSFDLNYQNIESITCNLTPSTSCSCALAGATTGALFGGIIGAIGGAIGGALLGSSSVPVLEIVFRDKTNRLKKLEIVTKSQEVAKTFIAAYQKEIEITKRTNRKPGNSLARKFAIFLICILALGLLAIALPIAHSSGIIKLPAIFTEASAIVQETDAAQPTPADQQPLPEPATSDTWTTISDTQCSLSSSSGALTVTQLKNSAQLELRSADIPKGLSEVTLIFDRNTPTIVKCSTPDNGALQLTADHKLLKNMRKATSLKVIVPISDQNDKTLKFTLMGFSKSCAWTQ